MHYSKMEDKRTQKKQRKNIEAYKYDKLNRVLIFVITIIELI